MNKSNVASLLGMRSRLPFNSPPIEWVLKEQLIGIEVEVDLIPNENHPKVLAPYWNTVRDGSLISGKEYVLASPLYGETLTKSINDFFVAANLERSPTGSTHIHIDMLEESVTAEMVQTLVLMVYALEPAIFATIDPSREFCGYTNKLSSAPDSFLAAIFSITPEAQDQLKLVAQDVMGMGRYYGLNVLALNKYGSLEWRYFPTARSAEELSGWINLVMSFKKAAAAVQTADNLNDIFNDPHQYFAFIHQYFAQWADDMLTAVPQQEAAKALYGALAVSNSYKVREDETKELDAKILASTKLMKKFAKKGQAEEPAVVDPSAEPILYLAPGQCAPTGAERHDGQVIASGDQIYGAFGTRWIELMHDSIDNYPGAWQPTARQILATLVAGLPTVVNDARAVGINNTSANTLRAVANMSIERVRNTLMYYKEIKTPLLVNEQPNMKLAKRQAPTYRVPMPSGLTSGSLRTATEILQSVGAVGATVEVDEDDYASDDYDGENA